MPHQHICVAGPPGHDTQILKEDRTLNAREMPQEVTKTPDSITMAAILLLKSRLRNDGEIADALNQNIPKVGSTIEITSQFPFEEADIERLWEHMLCHHRNFVSQMDNWTGDELVSCGVNFILDGSLGNADIPTVSLEEMPRAVCDYAAASLGDEDTDAEADATLTRWLKRCETQGW
ncbi:hypothetical protein MMC11_004033 [Xylographa trunciseda]|nr:hypothetical protein [Xylographa trunciseda]